MEGIKDILEELPQTRHIQTARAMFELLTKEKITLNEYLRRCASWGVKTLDDLYFKHLPTKPLEVIEFEQIPRSNRLKFGWGFFSDHLGIIKYYEERRRVILENSTSLWRMRQYKKHTPESRTESHKKLDDKITDFKMKMDIYEK